MKQRYHYNVANSRIEQHVDKGNDDGLFISSVSCAQELWALIMDAGTGFSAQVWELSTQFLPKDWILEQWDDGYYITALAGSTTGSALVIMSKGTPYTQQSYKVSDSFPFKWINKKWKEGFYVTSMATSGTRWAVVMSRNAGFVDQCVELDFMYPSEGIHRRWDSGFRITCCAATPDQAAFVLSIPRRRPADETQETLQHLSLPEHARQGEVGQESLHQRSGVRTHGVVSEMRSSVRVRANQSSWRAWRTMTRRTRLRDPRDWLVGAVGADGAVSPFIRAARG